MFLNLHTNLNALWLSLQPTALYRKHLTPISKKISSSSPTTCLSCGFSIGEFVARREPMLFITGVGSVTKTITKSANFSSRRKLWGFNITRRKTHFAKTNSLSMTIFTTKIACNSVTTIKTMKTRVFIKHCLRDF